VPGHVLALDQGTTSSRAIVFDEHGRRRGFAQHELPQHFPQPGWVEHDPQEIWDSQLAAARAALNDAGLGAAEIAAIGITNQRETSLIWDRATGAPIYPAIVWQSRQTADICEEWRSRGLGEAVQRTTGLVVDAYFSASKVRWILDAVPGAQQRAERGELAFGTVDSWLICRLTGGAHVTDETNASRTMLYDIHARQWSQELLAAFDIPAALLPEVLPSSGDFWSSDSGLLGASIPIRGVAGDQQAALFGQGCVGPGDAKNTYGTGCFLLLHTGSEAPTSSNGLLSTVAADARGSRSYALEGGVFVAGAAIQWLRDGLGLIATAAESEALATSVPDTGGAYLVPAFAGLGAPHWDEAARGTVVGLTRGTGRAQLVRAALESIAYQTRDLVDCIVADAGSPLTALRVDGGACRNDFLMQFQADLLGIPLHRPRDLEVTALGAAGLAGIAAGVWADEREFATVVSDDIDVIEPRMASAERDALCAGWRDATELRAQSTVREPMTASHARDADIAVIGAGVVGLAVAFALSDRGSVVVLEANDAPGRETSSHNTGIVHAGMFYPAESLKHRLCLEGNRLLHEWVDRYRVPLRRCGKLIVAPELEDVGQLDAVWEQGAANSVPDFRRLTASETHALEPRIRAHDAVWSGTSSVIEQAEYIRSLESACRSADVLFAYRHRVTSAAREDADFVLEIQDAEGAASRLRAGVVVTAAGHGAPAIAEALGYALDGSDGLPVLAQRKNRGVYYDFVDPDLGRAVSRPVYPVPSGRDVAAQQARAGGLGLHLSIDVDGVAHLGPDTRWLPDDVDPDYRSVDDDREPFVAAARRLLGPNITGADLQPGQVGYRPKLAVEGFTDFVILVDRGYVHLGGIESPGLTASLAVGREVAARLA